ncbi:DUF3592 domain-containing protein [Aromatoleum diolicum]|uniref:DUF3592 domain-containing protein n=1 Tax=Aromatoleum diolicum TaxID=75796 RepID=A0ABX1QBL6_9RHOO|nr:DUF3592 domain-containing protein [Aromatoleum diolicum]NMG75786.1 DUF3592 domain-containing protein [Aromatoleum diolicum]
MFVPQAPSSLRVRLASLVIRVGVPLLGVTLLILGLLGLVSFAVLPAFEALRSRDWQPVPAVLETVAVQPPPSRLHPPLDAVAVRYRYTIGGIDYAYDCFDPHAGLYLHKASSEVLAELRASREIVVWVNPANPAEAMARRDLRWPVLLFSLPALLMSLIGGLLVFAGMLAWNNVDLKLARRPSGGH